MRKIRQRRSRNLERAACGRGLTWGGAGSAGKTAPLEEEGNGEGKELAKEELRSVEGQDVTKALNKEFGTETKGERNVVAAKLASGDNGSADPSGHGRKLVTYDDVSPMREESPKKGPSKGEESPKLKVIMPKARRLSRIAPDVSDDVSLSPPSSLSGDE